MNSFTPHGKKPEAIIQEAVIKMLRYKGWYVKRIPGSTALCGFPDLFATHSMYGIRLIEIKRPEMKGSKFTAAQLQDFPKFASNGAGIWILTGDSETEYKKLFKKYNYWEYMM